MKTEIHITININMHIDGNKKEDSKTESSRFLTMLRVARTILDIVKTVVFLIRNIG